MRQSRYKISFLISFLLLIGIQVSAQLVKKSGINIGVKLGGAKLISEFSKNQSINEFTNSPGFAASLEISKILFRHIEPGIDFSYSNLNGSTENTDHFSAIGYHAAFPEPLYGPTEY